MHTIIFQFKSMHCHNIMAFIIPPHCAGCHEQNGLDVRVKLKASVVSEAL